MPNLLHLPPLSLYIHVPWCVRKCPYCDFNSHEAKGEIPEAQYLNVLKQDLDSQLLLTQGRKIHSVFIGGGTPSLMSGQFFSVLIEYIDQRIGFDIGAEITLEANPGTVEVQKFRDFKRAGVNRLSIGVQSFQPQHLDVLGRIHSADDAKKAAEAAHSVGLENFNIDLMHGLPDQSIEQACDDLKEAFALSPQHISWYQLTIEQNTQYFRYPPVLPEDDTLADIQDAGQALLAKNGYAQYEISAYAQPNRQSKHNINYWTFGDYLAIGAGAHAKITLAQNGVIKRYWKTRHPKDYMQRIDQFNAGEQIITPDELPFEYMMNVLRLHQPFTTQAFEMKTGIAFQTIQPKLLTLVQRGFLQHTHTQWETTALGKQYLNTLLEALL